MQLLCQKWPAEIAAKYARAYARHGAGGSDVVDYTRPRLDSLSPANLLERRAPQPDVPRGILQRHPKALLDILACQVARQLLLARLGHIATHRSKLVLYGPLTLS